VKEYGVKLSREVKAVVIALGVTVLVLLVLVVVCLRRKALRLKKRLDTEVVANSSHSRTQESIDRDLKAY
jgi:low affinity Fe/Cu permease